MPTTHHRLRTAAALLLTVAAAGSGAATATAADAPQDLSSTGADRTLYGIGAASRTGWAVAPAGDVNGDGVADAIIGAPGEEKGAGAAYVVFGRAGGSPLSALRDLGDGGFRIGGAAPGDQAGLAVSAAGDVNGDGLTDVAIGAPGATASGRAGAGVVYVVYGKKTVEPVSLGALGAGGYGILGAAPGDAAGTALASLGDEGADGVPDLAVGAPTAAGGRAKGGAAYVVAGHKAGGDVDLADPASGPSWRLNGPTGGFAGLAVAAVPDLNGDGVSEIAVGAPATAPSAIDDAGIAEVPEGHETRGAAYVVFGHGGTAAEDLPTLPAERGWRLRGGAADAALGTALAAGDLDGDGAADVAIGAPQSDEANRKDSGSAYVLFGTKGAAGATVDLSAPGTMRVLRVDGAGAGDALGAGLAVPGDLDADGKADLVVSAVFAKPFDRIDAGAAYRIGGPLAPGTLDAGTVPATATFAGSTQAGHLRAISAGGDLDGDGAVDLLLGEPEGTPSAELPGAGTVRVVRGVAPALVTPPPTEPDPGVQEEIDQDGCRAA
ncbi:MAG TPA: integrin alpha, partial [Baekduia sp.]|nr:integrin alpha [Baekduia sp.]